MIGGKLQTAGELHRAYNDLKNIDETFTTMVNTISVEMMRRSRRISGKRSEDAFAESAFAGFSYMGIKLIRKLNDDTADIDISNAEITNITVSCDGMPLVVIDNGETISINEGDRYVYFDCYDKDSGVTSAENADESKAFKFDGKNEIEVTFTISGISTR